MMTAAMILIIVFLLGIVLLHEREASREIAALKIRVWYLEHPDISANGEHSRDGGEW